MDYGILVSTFFLVLISLATLYSLELNQVEPDFSLFRRQALSAVFGFFSIGLLFFFDYRYLKDMGYLIYAAGIIMLVMVLFFGVTLRGTTGWFRIGGGTFQPVELFKLILIVTLAKFYSIKRTVNTTRALLFALVLLVVPTLLIYLQPDVGSLIVLIAVWFGLLFVLQLRPLYIAIFLIFAIVGGFLAWQFLFAPYQKERILAFVHPTYDVAGAGYNVQQAKIAIGSGRFLGRGLGLGSQSSLNFLPEQETDFIFAAIAESLGFLGGSLLILLYTFLLWRLLHLTDTVTDEFGIFLILGIFFWFTFQGFANIAMNLGMIPVFGIPLPFISYGGSSLFASLLAVGVVESVCLFSARESSLVP